jgi:hypothetical protein
MKIIKCAGYANGQHCPTVGEYVRKYDPDAHNGIGFVEFTNDKSRAIKFPSIVEAIRFWQQTSVKLPLRADGKPNRPLTAMNAEIVDE